MRSALVLLLYCLVDILKVRTEFIFELFDEPMCHEGVSDVTIDSISYASCLDECRARDTCTGVSYRHAPPVCIVHSRGEAVGTSTSCGRYVYSQKSEWREKTISCDNKRCDATRTMCTGADDQCVYKDCEYPKIGNPNLKVYGNRIPFGSTLALQCPLDNEVNTIKYVSCTSEGEWTSDYPQCEQPTTAAPTPSPQDSATSDSGTSSDD